jgi:[acyl-carrier-protein] S-malonyltransferase
VIAAGGIGLLFPGQGSQFVGMGKDLAESFPAARDTFAEADDALGLPLTRLCWEGPAEDLTLTANAQPAILVHSIAVWRVIEHAGLDVAVAAGHSLGEFSAYVAAGSISFRDALQTVRRRGELMLRSGEERPGTMAAILGLDDDAVEQLCRDASAPGSQVVAANLNAPGQIVISGDEDAVERAGQLARERGAKRALPLNVSGAFHSPLMEVAEPGLREQLDRVAIAAPAFPVVSNVTAEPVMEASAAKRLLIEQLTSPVRWAGSVRAMRAAGIDRFLELGPGNVLAGLLKRIDRDARGASLATAASVEAFLTEEVGSWS